MFKYLQKRYDNYYDLEWYIEMSYDEIEQNCVYTLYVMYNFLYLLNVRLELS